MRGLLWFLVAAACCVTDVASANVAGTGDWNQATRLLLAQSCVAEAGFDSAQTGECAAIAWVYVKRIHQMRRRGHDISLLEMIRRYSQPIRHRRRLWVMTLNHELEQPRGWPRRWPPWDTHYRHRWQQMLEMVDEWAHGVPDPCPSATHFGSVTDRPGARMVRIRCNVRMRNRFYRVR